ncbi:GGDEF domain-containing protein [Rhodoferax sp. GW822-FHT02A01]|uniref:GGDEF domain-containing protein n=1 Tax=Rhodoferax sp. GW822-FHT02A01 TaxID=3141537 RepID=UPI00315D592D
MLQNLPNEHWVLLSTEPAGRREYRLALCAILFSALVLLCAAPFAKSPLEEFSAFLPAYVAALVLCDLITAALLFSQYGVLRAPALLVLAGGYVFSCLITLVYALSFPNLFWSPQVTGAGPQTSSAMYMFWHGGFPLFVIAYANTRRDDGTGGPPETQTTRAATVRVVATVFLVLALVTGFTLFALRGNGLIPTFLDGNQTTPLGHGFLLAVWLLSATALVALWRKKPHSVLDVWLLVVLCVWLCDIALGALLNTGRYDLGWYVGRMYGLLAASLLLIVLLIEHGRQYARLVQLSMELGTANQALATLSRHDGLTGLSNRRYLDEYLDVQITLAKRQRDVLALVLIDVDHFKLYNDRYGHPRGDECLKVVATALQKCTNRPADMVARYGGEEFAVVLPGTDLHGAIQVADSIRIAVANLNIAHAGSPTAPSVSISAGVAAFARHAEMTAERLLVAADDALYSAKRRGRNRVDFAEEL